MFKLKNYSRKCMAFLSVAGLLIVYAFLFMVTNSSSGARRPFALADDFPRGALVYAQFRDLPALVRLWNESALKQRYLESQNFKEFQNRHLALKLVARLDEFNAALGFELDVAKIAGASEKSAAVAIYDIGKLEIVFVAPLAGEKVAAALEFWNQSGFEENALPDGTVYFSREVEADRGRQKQKIVFASFKGRFVIATSEDLLLKTIANLSGKAKKNRLSDDPDFARLTAKIEPHLATVWVNQLKLNEDWYFKHYWVMHNIERLKNIRAGMFDFEITDDKVVERRRFLVNENAALGNLNVPAAEVERLRAVIPADIPYFKLQSVADNRALATDLINKTLFEKLPAKLERKRRERWNSYNSFAYDAEDHYDYSRLGASFDKHIDEDETDETISPAGAPSANLSSGLEQILHAANASSAVFITGPRILENPLFAEFRRATIFNLRSPANFNRAQFEKTVLEIVQNHLGVAGASLNLAWETKAENKNSWRELNLPALGWGLGYTQRKNELLIANNAELLKILLEDKKSQTAEKITLDELTVINLSTREKAFDGVMRKLAAKKQTGDKQTAVDDQINDFFVGNIGSLLDAATGVNRIEIRKNRAANYLHEEISFILKRN